METPRAGKAGDGNGTATSGTHDAAPMLALQVSSPALLLNHMAERYTSFGRILSEFVDNSFDAAEPWLEELDHNTASAAAGYSRPVRIAIAIDSERSSVYVTDNASGMDSSTLARVVCRVGDSVKRGMREVNGQFGFGMQAFRSCAQQLVVTSRAESGGGTSRIAVSRNDVTGFVLTEVRAGEPIPDDEYSLLSRSSSTGTEICIAGIDEQWREESMDARAIARELEEHFERLLARPGLEMVCYEIKRVAGRDGAGTGAPTASSRAWYNSGPGIELSTILRCQPFSYTDPCLGAVSTVRRTFVWPTEEDRLKPGGERTLAKVSPQVFSVCLVITSNEVEAGSRPRPRFFVNGRRISEVAKTASFTKVSNERWRIWENPQVLGYLDIHDVDGGSDGALKPVITRDEFKKTKGRRGAYAKIIEATEGHLREVLEEVNSKRSDRRLGSLEVMLNDCLTSVARSRKGSGFRPPTTAPGAAEAGAGAVAAAPEPRRQREKKTPTGAAVPAEERVSMSHAEPAPRERRRADLDFEIILTSTSADGPDSFAPRSRLEGNQIVVNVSHPDFVERLKKTRVGKETFDSRLLSYLAAIVSAHYRDLTYQQLGSRPESCSDMLDCYVQLEERLRKHLPSLLKQLENEHNISPLQRRRWRDVR